MPQLIHWLPHSKSKDKWEGRLQTTMKEVHLESRPERMNRVCFPDVPGQGIPLGRGKMSEGLLAPLLGLTVLGSRSIKKRLIWGGDVTQLAVLDQPAADSGSTSKCGKAFFSQNGLSVQALLRCPYTPVCNRMH